MAAAAGAEDFLKPVIEKRVEVCVSDEEDRSAGTTVAAARAAARHELLAAERHGATATVTGRDVNVDFVYEHAKEILSLERQHADHAPLGAMILELDLAVDLRKKRVVFAETDIQAGSESTPALAHQYRSAGDDVAVVSLDAQPLRIAVAAVA